MKKVLVIGPFTCLAIVVFATSPAGFGQIVLWEGDTRYNDPNDYHINQELKTIAIYRSDPNQPWGFRSLGSGEELAGEINDISLDANKYQTPVDTVILKITTPTGGIGASKVKRLNLHAGLSESATSVIQVLRASSTLGDLGSIEANGAGLISAAGLENPMHIYGDFTADLELYGPVEADITVDGVLSGDVSADNLQDFTITGGTSGSPLPTIHVEDAYGADYTMTVNGSLYSLQFDGGVAGSVTVDGTVGSFEIDSGGLSGELHTGNLDAGTIVGNVTGEIDVDGNLASADHTFSITSKLVGSLTASGALAGRLSMGDTDPNCSITLGSVGPDASVETTCQLDCEGNSGQITVLGDWQGQLAWGSGSFDADLRVMGDLNGAFFGFGTSAIVSGTIRIDGDCVDSGIAIGGTLRDPDRSCQRGQILINGAFKDGSYIFVNYMEPNDPSGFTEAICIDFDGFSSGSPNDRWEDDSYIQVDNLLWYSFSADDANDPFYFNCFEVTCCKGDLDNDGRRTLADAGAMADAIDSFDPNWPCSINPASDYYLNYPGLSCSMVNHGDFDCDGDVDEDDADELVDFIGVACPGSCTGPGDEEGMLNFDAKELAAQLKAYLTDKQLERWQIIAGTLAVKREGDRGQFWKSVYDELQK